FLSLSMTPPSPTSTLFPYTTLFRSRPDVPRLRRPLLRSCRNQGRASSLRRRRLHERTLDHLRRREAPSLEDRRPRPPRRPPNRLDRKSTRLNSSHLGISYAVFCLKK